MVGGIAGTLFMLYVAIVSSINWLTLIVLAIMAGVFVLSLFAVFGLWRGTEFGKKASIAIQIIQLPKFSSAIFVLMFSFGFDVFPVMIFSEQFSNIGIQLRFLADGQLYLGPQNAQFGMGFSITALIALAILHNYDPSLQEEKPETFDLPPSPDKFFDLRKDQD